MAGFANLKQLVETHAASSHMTTWRKTPSQTTGAGIWFDLSMSPGNPAAQYYAAAPLVATQLARSTDGGLNHGGNVSSSYKYLRSLTALTVTATAVPLNMILCDYLLYYPFVDESLDASEQTMTNSATLPRYTDGDGVQMMAVEVAAHAVGTGVSFTVNYTNSSGVSGRTSKVCQLNTQFVNGTLVNTAPTTANCHGPFIGLQNGDTGVRSVEGVTMSGSDVGLFSVVLVKPLARMSIRGIDAPVEVDYLKDFSGLPRIIDDAYLNFIVLPNGTLSGAPIHGMIETTWG